MNYKRWIHLTRINIVILSILSIVILLVMLFSNPTNEELYGLILQISLLILGLIVNVICLSLIKNAKNKSISIPLIIKITVCFFLVGFIVVLLISGNPSNASADMFRKQKE